MHVDPGLRRSRPRAALRAATAAAAVGALLLGAAPLRAESFGGWSFTPPADWPRSVGSDHVKFTRISGRSFCQFIVYSAHPPTTDDVRVEWSGIVESAFDVRSSTPPTRFTTARGLAVVARSASVVEKKNGAPFAFTLYVLQPPGAGGAVLAAANDEATLAKCPTAALLDSISFIGLPPGSAPPAATAGATAAAAPAAAQPAAGSVVGAWGTSSGNPASNSGTGSVLRRQYVFNPDGSYTYFSELFDGSSTWIHVRESGRWEVAGDRLTVAPTSSTISSRDWNAVRGSKPQPLEKVTYTFRTHYFTGLREWNLVLTPPARTERDGPFAVNAMFPNSYLLSNTFRPEWKWP